MHIEKVDILFGRSPSDGAAAAKWASAYAGVPGRLLLDGAARIPAPLSEDASPPTVNGLDETGRVVNFPLNRGQGSIQCITIAPDSPIECVDLYFNGQSGQSVHRLSSWSPWFGKLDNDVQIRVVPVRSVPYLGHQIAADTDAIVTSTVHWDMTVTKDLGIVSGSSIADAPSVQVPVRLNVYRGCMPPVTGKRAPYNASMVWDTGNVLDGADLPTGVAQIQSAGMYVITDGRRRVRVVAGQYNSGAIGAVRPTMAVYGVEGYKSTVGSPFDVDITADRRVDAYNRTPLLAATEIPEGAGLAETPLVFDYVGNPFFAFLVLITYDDETYVDCKGYANVHCWDD
jgi:hypothetical protein